MKEKFSFKETPIINLDSENDIPKETSPALSFERNRLPHEDMMYPDKIEVVTKLESENEAEVEPIKDIITKPVPKKRTIEVIQNTRKPHYEHAFVKLKGGGETLEIEPKSSSPGHVHVNLSKYEADGGKKYNFIHTHPSKTVPEERAEVKKPGLFKSFFNWIRGSNTKRKRIDDSYPRLLPSSTDIKSFLFAENMKYATIAVRDPESGIVLGYNVLSKTKDSPSSVSEELKKGNKIRAWWKKFKLKRYTKRYYENIIKNWEAGNQKKIRETFDDFLTKYKIKSKLVPADGYKVNDAGVAFEKVQQ